MEFGKALQNLSGSVTGNVCKAILCVRAVEDSKIDQKDDEGIDAMGASMQSAITDVVDLDKKLKARAEKSLAGKKVANLDEIADIANQKSYIALEVQFNPTSLRLETSAGRQLNYDGGSGNVELKQFRAPSSTSLSMELLFDDVYNNEAFGSGDSPISGKGVVNMVDAGFNGKKEHSVMRVMEGLLSLLAIPAARQVIFFWGNMSFRGEVTEVDEKYTMFNKKGQPIRGTVHLNIRQGDASADAMLEDLAFRYDDAYWEDAFDDTFQAPGGGGGLLDTMNSYTNNSLLNLKL